MPGTWVGEGPGGRRCRARRRRHSIPADPACDSEVVGEGAPVVARKRGLAVRETVLIVVLPGVPAADDDGRAIMSGDVLSKFTSLASAASVHANSFYSTLTAIPRSKVFDNSMTWILLTRTLASLT